MTFTSPSPLTRTWGALTDANSAQRITTFRPPCLQPLFHFSLPALLLRISAQILHLMRIVLQIKELLAAGLRIQDKLPLLVTDHALRVGERAGDELVNMIALMLEQGQ